MTRLFIGGLASDISQSELEREFEAFGRIEDSFVARNPPGFGFIVFVKSRDAEEAIHKMDGQILFGGKIRVEYARERGGGRGSIGSRSGGGYRGGSMSGIKCFSCGEIGHISKECKNNRSYGFGSVSGGRKRSRSTSYERPRRRSRRSISRSRSRSRERYRR